MIKRILQALFLILIVVILWNWSLVSYGINQGLGQLKIVWNARPIKEFLDDPNFPDSLKAKLKLIDEVRAFAIDSLGLQDTENYKTLYDQKGKELMWVVTASERFQLKPKLWEFPVVGVVPYKGFFDEKKAIAEKEKLEKDKWDVGVRNPGGWSTLGWFTDPILSGMLARSEGDLASLIIHEMVHSTIFIKDSVDFNENLASFIGDSAAYVFLASKYGVDSEQYLTYVYEDQDYRKLAKHILQGTTVLDSVYQTMKEDDSEESKIDLKKATIRSIIENLDTLTLIKMKSPSKRFKGRLPNNDYFMNYKRYQSKQTNFKDQLDTIFGGDVRKMIADYKKRYPFL